MRGTVRARSAAGGRRRRVVGPGLGRTVSRIGWRGGWVGGGLCRGDEGDFEDIAAAGGQAVAGVVEAPGRGA